MPKVPLTLKSKTCVLRFFSERVNTALTIYIKSLTSPNFHYFPGNCHIEAIGSGNDDTPFQLPYLRLNNTQVRGHRGLTVKGTPRHIFQRVVK